MTLNFKTHKVSKRDAATPTMALSQNPRKAPGPADVERALEEKKVNAAKKSKVNQQDQPAQNSTSLSPPDSRPKEIGGPSGPEPTRYGDWERNGICSDF